MTTKRGKRYSRRQHALREKKYWEPDLELNERLAEDRKARPAQYLPIQMTHYVGDRCQPPHPPLD